MIKLLRALPIILLSVLSQAATNIIVQVSEDGATTIPAGTIATPAQVANLSDTAEAVYLEATNLQSRAASCESKISLYTTNYVVTSTVYVQSIGGVPFDPSNQTVTVESISATADNVLIVATVKQTPLVTPTLDWRAALNTGGWTNLTATVSDTAIPTSATNAAKAYLFTLPKPSASSSFFRVVDNSSGASGSGLWWLVYGGIYVDGKEGLTGTITNGTDELRFVGGILVEPTPLGE